MVAAVALRDRKPGGREHATAWLRVMGDSRTAKPHAIVLTESVGLVCVDADSTVGRRAGHDLARLAGGDAVRVSHWTDVGFEQTPDCKERFS